MALLTSRSTPTERCSGNVGDGRNPTQSRIDDHPDVRRPAAQLLASDSSSSALLIARLADESSLGVRAGIVDALISQRSPAVVEGLLPLLRSGSAPLRTAVIEALQHMPELVAPKIGALLQDPSADVRVFTVHVLESLRHPGVTAWLIGVLERDSDVNVCAAAVDVLGEVGDHTAIPALEAVKARFPQEPFIQFAAAVALGQIE